jgi:hypothetical protein
MGRRRGNGEGIEGRRGIENITYTYMEINNETHQILF